MQGGPWLRHGNETFSVFKARADQWAVLASMESSAYYRCLEDDSFMSNFDVRMTYHRTAEVPLLYWSNRHLSLLKHGLKIKKILACCQSLIMRCLDVIFCPISPWSMIAFECGLCALQQTEAWV